MKWLDWLGPILAMAPGAALGYLLERDSLRRACRLFDDARESYGRAKASVERERQLMHAAAGTQGG